MVRFPIYRLKMRKENLRKQEIPRIESSNQRIAGERKAVTETRPNFTGVLAPFR